MSKYACLIRSANTTRLEDYPSGGECQGRSLTHLSSLVCDHDQRAVSRAVRRLIAAICIAGIVARIRSYVPLLCASEVSCAFWITLLHLSRLSRNAAPKIESCRLPLPVACAPLSYGRFAFPTPQSEYRSPRPSPSSPLVSHFPQILMSPTSPPCSTSTLFPYLSGLYHPQPPN